MPEVELEHKKEEPVDTPEVDETVEDLENAKEEPGKEAEELEPEDEGEPQSPTIEELATEMGWKPKDNFAGHEDDYVDAPEYIRRSKDIQDSMRQHLKDNKRKMSGLEKAITDIKTHYETVNKAQLKDLKGQIESTKSKRREAIEEGDPDEVEKLDDQLSELYNDVAGQLKNIKGEDQPEADPEEEESFKGWVRDNNWYNFPGYENGNSELTEYADKLADLPEYKAIPYKYRLQKVEAKVKEMFPEKFEKAELKPPAVESGSKKSVQKNRLTERNLTSEQRDVMNNFVRQGIMSKEEYIKDLADAGGLE